MLQAIQTASRPPRLLTALASLTFTICATAQTVPVNFGITRDFAAGDYPADVAIGDFNHDGFPDLAITDQNSNGISILLGIGNGAFKEPVHYKAGSEPFGIAAGDVNGDGVIDLVATNSKGVSISVLLGNGDGTFKAAQFYKAISEPYAVVLADMNGDGKLDAVLSIEGVNESLSAVAVMLGNGDGTFKAPIESLAGEVAGGLRVADFNRDGKLDVVLAGGNNTYVLLGKGDGTFGAPQASGTGTGISSVDIADFNNDGKLDIVTGDYYTGTIEVLLGNGDGTFGVPVILTDGVAGATTGVVAADFNNDGKIDIADMNFGSVSVLLGDGQGHFLSAGRPTAVNQEENVLAAADLNHDGKTDLIVPGETTNVISVLLGNGSGGFVHPYELPVHNNANLCGPAVADTNRDGIPDLIVAGAEIEGTVVYLGNGNGTFNATVVSKLGNNGCGAIAAGDLNGDGIPDLIVGAGGFRSLLVELGNGDGTFRAGGTYPVPEYAISIVIADMNNDGKLDVVTTGSESTTVSVLLGNGDGTLAAANSIEVGNDSLSVAVTDFNGDGKLDIVAAGSYQNTISILLGNGDGTFTAATQLVLPSQDVSFSVTVADFNGDGKPDVAALVNFYSQTWIYVFDGLGDGTFAAPTVYPRGFGTGPIFAIDLNGDGNPDIAALNGIAQNVGVLLNEGDGAFVEQHAFWATDLLPFSFAIADLNGDGKPDIAVANDSTITVLINKSAQ